MTDDERRESIKALEAKVEELLGQMDSSTPAKGEFPPLEVRDDSEELEAASEAVRRKLGLR